MSSTPVDVLLDTNALWSKECKGRLIQAVRKQVLRVHIPALVLVERERQLAQRDRIREAGGSPTTVGRSVRLFRQWIEQLLFDLSGEAAPDERPVLAFDQAQAQWVSVAWDEWLARQSPEYLTSKLDTDEATKQLRRRFRRKWRKKPPCPPDLDWMVDKVDWAIAAVARHTGWLLVTDDQGESFQQPGVRTMSVAEFSERYLTGE